METNLNKTKGLVFSQRILLALADKGLERPKAYDIVQRCAMKVWDKGISFQEAVETDKDAMKHLSKSELKGYFNLKYYVRYTNKIFKTVGI